MTSKKKGDGSIKYSHTFHFRACGCMVLCNVPQKSYTKHKSELSAKLLWATLNILAVFKIKLQIVISRLDLVKATNKSTSNWLNL